MSEYIIHTHQFHFSIWAASRAYTRGVPSTGMPVPYKTAIDVGLDLLTSPDHIGYFEKLGLPKPCGLALDDRTAVVDAWTIALIHSIQKHSAKHRPKAAGPIPFGCAAKLLSVYLKAVLLNESNIDHPNIALMHPPIDSILLKGISKAIKAKDSTVPKTVSLSFYHAIQPETHRKTVEGFSWQNMSERQYLELIYVFRSMENGLPLLGIEKHWNLTAE